MLRIFYSRQVTIIFFYNILYKLNIGLYIYTLYEYLNFKHSCENAIPYLIDINSMYTPKPRHKQTDLENNVRPT